MMDFHWVFVVQGAAAVLFTAALREPRFLSMLMGKSRHNSLLMSLIGLFVTILAPIGCAERQVRESIQKPSNSELKNLPFRKLPTLSYNETRRKIERFRRYLNGTKPLPLEAWSLHDELLAAYIQLKDHYGSYLKLPAKSKTTLTLKSFCLDSNKSGPAAEEVFYWKKSTPNIPYYRKLLDYWHEHQKIPQSEIQTLLWNLGNGTYFEDYPSRLRSILLDLDPMVLAKLPSRTKSRTKEIISDWLETTVPEIGAAKDILKRARRQFRDYAEIASDISKLSSHRPFSTNPEPQPVEDTLLFAETQSEGFSFQNVTLYNPTDKDIQLNPRNYYLLPERNDVQRIGITQGPSVNGSLLSALEKVLYDDMARLGIGFVPVANDVADLLELVSGKDFISGRALSGNERLLSGLGLIIGSGANYRWAQRMTAAPEKMLPKFEKGLEQVSKRFVASLDQREIGRTLERAEDTVSKLRQSPTLNRIAKKPGASKTDFYVRSNGDVIPAKGYRYVKSEATYLKNLVEEGHIPTGRDPTYITFQDFSDAATAKRKLQVEHDARYKVIFDTKQILEDLRIPRGRWGTKEWLEPLTKAFPEFGEGGATQAITNLPIQAEKIIDLRTGLPVYGSR